MNRLSEAEHRALLEALEDEYRAWSTYDQVITDFGEVRPFVNIRDAEARHIDALRTLFVSYGLDIPANTWPGRVTCYASIEEACEAGVAAEVENGALYDRLLSATTRPDILATFRHLQEASQERHLAAFRRCAGRRAGGAPGCGGGRRHGQARSARPAGRCSKGIR